MTKNKKVEPEEERKILSQVADSITEKPSTINVDVKPSNFFEAWLIKRKIKPSKRVFEIKPQRVVNVYRIAGRVVKLDVDGIFANTDRIGSLMRTMAVHGEDIFYIVAAAIQNDSNEPSKKMINIVKNEFEMQDILTVMQIAVSNYNITAFLSSIALMTGMDALSLNPNQEASPVKKGG